MKLVNKYYGYPVLSSLSDDYAGKFKASIDTVLNDIDQKFQFKVTLDFENVDIQELIDKGKATFSLHLEESKTCYRKVLNFTSKEYEFSVPYGEIRENLDAIVFIIAKEQITGFLPKSIHDFYKGIELKYEPYQLIGISNYNLIEIIKELDEIKEASSIFVVIPDKSGQEELIKLDLQEERIVITMPDDDFRLYDSLSRRNSVVNYHRDILLSNIVMPVMVEVFQLLKESEGLYESRIWYKSIVHAYEEKGIKIETEMQKDDFSPLKYSQIIFENVIKKAMEQARSLMEAARE